MGSNPIRGSNFLLSDNSPQMTNSPVVFDVNGNIYGKRPFMSYLYILPLKDKSAFKIGKSDSPMKRITRLLNFYDIDTTSVTIIDCRTTTQSYFTETLFHKIFEEYNVTREYEGGTEFFNYIIYQDAMDLCNLICRVKGYSKIPFKADSSVKLLTPSQISANRFSTMLKNKRLELNLSQTDLAKAASISKRTVERFEKTGQATFENVLQMFSVLGIEDNFFSNVINNTTRKRAKKKLIFVGDSDHEPDKEWIQEISDEYTRT